MLLGYYYAFVLPILDYKSITTLLRYGGQLLFVTFSFGHLQRLELQVYSVARLCHYQSFLSLCHRRHVAGLCMLYKVNLFRTQINVCSVSFHLLLPELDIPELPQLVHWSSKYQGEECSNFQGVSCRPEFVYVE